MNNKNKEKYNFNCFENVNKNLDVFNLIKKKKCKFIETIDVSINLSIDVKNINQYVVGKVFLPHGIGRKNKVVVFSSDDQKDDLYSNGAYFVGKDDLFNKIKNNTIDYDVVITTPDYFENVSKLGQILGPKGLMPNVKLGTVTNDLVKCVKDFYNNQIIYRNDKFGVIHTFIGKINFLSKQLSENLFFLIKSINLNKPVGFKGNVFIKKICVCSTMGKSYVINLYNL